MADARGRRPFPLPLVEARDDTITHILIAISLL